MHNPIGLALVNSRLASSVSRDVGKFGYISGESCKNGAP